ncbi:Mini-ribonuclease 3 [Hyella patelloides LEGE 07179]|uniref:Mini-ribonuclease 3 n=1 Tax=Hyella patelloides LEGE 07179 TaxID=945734 RepID=A0A563VVQ6_9CYAN|nr:ribonuclease III domain-containing protein [Hyella patelloides]VEP15539.1 Mini-ribonuclease 3 [Hyella patelloides LEGE 07179]
MPDFNQKHTDSLWLRSKALTDEFLKVNNVPLEQLSPVALAYIGDAVYELYIRSKLLIPPKRIAEYHTQVVTQVRAETQATYLQNLEPYLTGEEKEILRRGRNAVTTKPKRLSAKIYQQASSLETLIGYLYLTNCDRLQDLLTKLKINSDVDG